MDFTLSADDEAVRDGIREFCQRQYGEDVYTDESWRKPELWRALAEVGVFSLRLPEEAGGAGLGMVETVLAFQELGRALVQGPVVATHLAAGVVDGAAEGRLVVSWLDSRDDPLIVEHPELVAGVLVAGAESVGFVPRDDLQLELMPHPMDPATPVALVTGSLPEPAADGWGAHPDALRRDGALLTAAYQVGIASAMTERSVAYAKEREQFGRAIGSFQAVKHLLADMLVREQLAEAAVHAAAVSTDDPETGDVDRAVAGAKLLADEAALLNARAAIQVHGGMGFTWEVPVHLYLKRAWLLSTTFGTADEHADALAGVT